VLVQYINADFASKYMKADVAVKLQNCNGEQWEIYCRSDNLSDGDECEVELIKKAPVVLKLLISTTS
jgi:hypothetical protein